MPPRGGLTPRTIMAPAAAFTMACVLFAYTRSSIKEARRSAHTHRDHGRNQGSSSNHGPGSGRAGG